MENNKKIRKKQSQKIEKCKKKVTVRFDDETQNFIEQEAQRIGVSKADFIKFSSNETIETVTSETFVKGRSW